MKRAVLVAGALMFPQLSAAQSVEPSKAFLVINGAYQLTANDFTDSASKRENAEDGRIETAYTVEAGPAFSVGGGGMLGRRLGVGVGVSRFTVSAPATIQGSVPHPFFFNRLRSVSGESSALTREELGIHVQARAIIPVGNRVEVALFGGPSFFQAKQGMVTDFSYTDRYPYDEAAFGSAVITEAKASKIGFNGGGDFAFFFSRQVGIGVTAQFAGTTVDLPAAGETTRAVKIGGMNVGSGLRVRF